MKTMKLHVDTNILVDAFKLMATAKAMTEVYEENFKWVSKYVHATSRGHEAIQIAVGMLTKSQDFISPYYRDDAMLLAIGMQPYELMLQLMAKKDDPFSGGRSYYSHPSLNRESKPKIIHQSSATGMQAIPTTGVALGIQYKEKLGMIPGDGIDSAVVICSLGDASITEGEVAEAFQMAALKQLPILYVVQDNEWDISATASEIRSMNAYEYIQGFKGIERKTIDGSHFETCFLTVSEIIQNIRKERRPFLLHARVPLLNHHTSGVRKEWYRDDLEEHHQRDPFPRLKTSLLEAGIHETQCNQWIAEAREIVEQAFEKAKQAPDPTSADLNTNIFAPSPVEKETGEREPAGHKEMVMVDSALIAIQQLMRKHKECLFYGQDVGGRLGGVFREAATLAQEFGQERVFNTPIMEAFIVGSTVGMSAVGLKPIVEVQFADYIWPGLNQLFTEVSRSYYLSNGKWPVSMVLRVPTGAYGGGGPYHSSSVESVVTNIKGIKIAYPSNGADLFGLMKSAYYDPNPVIIFEHKGLYWSKLKGTEKAKRVLPAEDYILPFGIAQMVLEAEKQNIEHGKAVLIITYGMGVYWALKAASEFKGSVSILDLRTLYPLDHNRIMQEASRHHRILVLTEEPKENSFSLSLAGRIQEECFEMLDAPVMVLGSANIPAIPLNEILEKSALPSNKTIISTVDRLLKY